MKKEKASNALLTKVHIQNPENFYNNFINIPFGSINGQDIYQVKNRASAVVNANKELILSNGDIVVNKALLLVTNTSGKVLELKVKKTDESFIAVIRNASGKRLKIYIINGNLIINKIEITVVNTAITSTALS
ncbi:MAG: hypothetical protein ABF633_19110 [Clostridium sp.]|uniref:hypothetical protein n=1 Tax=Clostridium sp. TaxID=1506 RepID=UPI0039E7536C